MMVVFRPEERASVLVDNMCCCLNLGNKRADAIRWLSLEIPLYTVDRQHPCHIAQSFRNTFSSLGSVGSFGLMVKVLNSRLDPLEPILSWRQEELPLLIDELSFLRSLLRRSAMLCPALTNQGSRPPGFTGQSQCQDSHEGYSGLTGPILSSICIIRNNATSRYQLSQVCQHVERSIDHEASNEPIGCTIAERDEHDRNKSWNGVSNVPPVDAHDLAHHQASDLRAN